MLNFTAADRVGVVGGYIGGISALLNGLGSMAAPAAVCSESQPVNRYEMNMALSLAQKDGEIATLKADKYTDQKLVEVYAELERRVNAVSATVQQNKEEQYQINLQQATYNGTNTAAMGCMQQQINALLGLTKLVVPNSSVCPGWGNVTITPATSTTTPAT